MNSNGINYSDTRALALESIVALDRANEWSSAQKPLLLHKALLASHSLFTAWDGAMLVVDGAHRGRGIGTRILDQLTAWAREQGCSRVELDSAFHRTDVHAFYERRGFQSRAYLYSKGV